MAAQQNVVRRIEVVGSSKGLGELEEDLRSVSDAQDTVAKSSDAMARTTETTSRRQVSVAGSYDRLRAKLDEQYRAQRQFERGQQTLDRAFQQGLATQAEYDRAMAQLRERFLSVTAANDNATKAAERHAAALRDMAEAERLAASISDNQARFNSLLGVGDSGAGSARDSAAVFEQAAREAEAFDASVAALRAQLDPLGAATQKLNAELASYADMAARGAITSDELAQAQALARQRFEEATGSAQKSVTIMDQLWASVSRLVLAYVSLQGMRMLGGMVDEWSEIQARVVNATGSIEDGRAVLERLGDMARRTYSDLNQTAESWLSSATSLSALGVSINDQLDLVESLNNAMVISATRGERAASVQRAWADAMALGKLSGDQLNSILTGSDRLAQALADSMGVNVNELRKLGAEGKITRAEMLGLSSQLEKLREEADAMPATLADGFTLMRNALLQTIGIMDQAGGASETFAAGLVAIADNMGRIVSVAATAVTAFGVYYVGAFIAANAATVTLTASLTLLRAALIRTGIGLLVVAAGELVYQFARLVEATGSFSGAFSELGRRAELIFDALEFGFLAMTEAMRSAWYGAMADILSITEASFGPILRAFGVTAESMAAAIDSATAKAQAWGDIAASSATIAAGQFKAAFADLKLPEADGLGGGLNRIADDLDKADKNARKLAEAYKRIVDNAQEYIQQQQLEAQLIGMTEQQANALRYEFDLLNEARRAGITLTDADRHGFKALAEAMAEAEERTRFLKDAFDFVQGTIKGFFSDLRSGLSEGKTFWEAFADAGTRALERIADKLIEMAFDQVINNFLRALIPAFGGLGGGGLGTNYFPPPPGGGLYATASTGLGVAATTMGASDRVSANIARAMPAANVNKTRQAQAVAASAPAASGKLAVRIEVVDRAGVKVEQGEPRREVNGELVLPMLLSQIEDRVAQSVNSGKVGRTIQQTFGLRRPTR